MIQNTATEIFSDQEKALQKLREGGKVTFIEQALGLIKRAQIRGPLYQPIVSVQPMTQPVGGIAFYRPQYGSNKGSTEKPAGADLRFEVDTIDALVWLYEQAGEVSFGVSPRKSLIGATADGKQVAAFNGTQVTITNGLGRVQPGAYEVKGLAYNEGYESFLLALNWRSQYGWGTELHAFTVGASDAVKIVHQEIKEPHDESD